MESVNVNEAMQGGLSNLMEAATALAKLTDQPSPPTTLTAPGTAPQAIIPGQPRNLISDEELDARRPIRNTKEIFPERLMTILNDASLTDIISWLPHGRSFVIIRPDVFTEQVLPKYLPPLDSRTSTKYPSFTRKLNRWYVQNIDSD